MADEVKKFAKHKIKNVSPGPRVFYPGGSTQGIALDPGAEWEGEIDIKQFERRDPKGEGAEWEIDGKTGKAAKEAAAADEFDKLSDVQLRDHVQKLNPKEKLANNISREELLKLARA